MIIVSVTEDTLTTLHFLAVKIFEHKLFIMMQVTFLGVYATALLANTYFFIKEFNMEFLNQYISVYLGLFSSVILYATLLWKQSTLKTFEDNCRPLIFHDFNLMEETHERIKKESQYTTSFIKFHLIFTLVSDCILIPVGRERKFQFGITFFQDYCHSYVLEALYLLGYPITGYMYVRIAYTLLYIVSHIKFRTYLIFDMIEHVSEGYDDQIDTELLDCDEYQKVLKARLVFMLTELIQIARVADLAAAILSGHLIPPLAVSGLLIGLSALSFVYLTENMFDAIYSNTRWTSFNKSNRKIILITMTVFQEPKRLRFTQTTSCNYEIGDRLAKTVYSFAAVMARLSDSQTIR
ncbi:hypothetical protein Zmor_024078 [Zophobas morio]|uniref:Odorant receptor n=1 Tax=Zophobas morio TaxID=2755281 RepID=A0AA38M8H7_9CUCU|nr:hypothetical protein Zmor_024078 [Zophobas morio]